MNYKNVRLFKQVFIFLSLSMFFGGSVQAAIKYSSYWPNSLHASIGVDKPSSDGSSVNTVAYEVQNPYFSFVSGYLICVNQGSGGWAPPGVQITKVYNTPGFIKWQTSTSTDEGIKVKGNEYLVGATTSVLDNPTYYTHLKQFCSNGHVPVRYISLAIILDTEQGGPASTSCSDYDYYYIPNLDISPLGWYWDPVKNGPYFDRRDYQLDNSKKPTIGFSCN